MGRIARRLPTAVGILCLAAFGAMNLWPGIALSHDARGYPGYHTAAEAPLSGFDDPRLQRSRNESDLAFAERVTMQVFRSTYHCDFMFTGHTWATALLAVVNPGFFTNEGLLAPSGFRCGWCHQRAWILAETLARGGVEAVSLGLERHVVTSFEIEGQTYVADADAGVPPFIATWDDRERLLDAVNRLYTMPGRTIYFGTFAKVDDFTVFPMERLRQIAMAQDRVIRAGTIFEWATLLVGLGLIGPALVRRRAGRLSRRGHQPGS